MEHNTTPVQSQSASCKALSTKGKPARSQWGTRRARSASQEGTVDTWAWHRGGTSHLSAPPKKAYTQSHSNHRRTPGEGLPKTLSGLYLPRLEFRFGSKSTFFCCFFGNVFFLPSRTLFCVLSCQVVLKAFYLKIISNSGPRSHSAQFPHQENGVMMVPASQGLLELEGNQP